MKASISIIGIILFLFVVTNVFATTTVFFGDDFGSDLFLFPGQSAFFLTGINAGVDSLDFFDFRVSHNDTDILHLGVWEAPWLNQNGNYSPSLGDNYFEGIWFSNQPNSWPGCQHFGLGTCLVRPTSNIDNAWLAIDLYAAFGPQINGGWEDYMYTNKTVFFHTQNRKCGDVNNDGVVNGTDFDVSLAGQTGPDYNSHLYTQGLNYAAAWVITPWVSWSNLWFLNHWLVDPTSPLVQGLGIGELFTYNGSPQTQVQIDGQIITIQPNGNNFFAVQGMTASGEIWSQEVFVDGSELLRFSNAMEPSTETNNRNAVQIVMPEGVTFIQAISRSLGTVTSSEDVTTVVPSAKLTAYPNPFSNTVSFTVDQKTVRETAIEIFNSKGQKISEVNSRWNGQNKNGKKVPAGIYFARVKGSGSNTTKILKLR
ncbi:MAG TPA: T9SS type A sorting domain-containing protein [bacterium]|nr:T9SS type A sorting domain-containing protein [bacterium]